jgi:chromosome segregation ATPase
VAPGLQTGGGIRRTPVPLYAVLSGHPPMTRPRGRKATPARPGGVRVLTGLFLFAALAAASGCALQSEVMEVQDEMAAIQSLQKQLEQQIADAQEAAETMRAIGFRMEAVEQKLKEGINPEVQARITQGLHDLDTALNGLDAKNKAIDERLGEAERFFVARVEEVSGRQQALSSRLSDLESSGLPPADRAARDEAKSELEVLKTQADAQTQGLKRMQEQFGLLTDRMAQLAAAQQATQSAAQARAARDQTAGADLEKVDLRLANLEADAAKGAQGRQQLVDQVGMLTDRIAGLTAGQQDKAQVSEAQATALEGRLAAAEQQAAANAAAQAELTKRMGEVTDRIAGLATGQQDKAQVSETQAAALDARLAAAEKRAAENAAAQAQLSQKVGEVADRMAGVATAQTQGATQATGAVQTLAGRLEALERHDADAAVASQTLAGRVDALEKQDAEARAAQQRLIGQVDLIAQRMGDLVAAQAAHKGEDPAALEARVTKLEGGKGQVERLAQLTDQLTLLGTQVTERLDAQAGDFTRLAARLDRIEQGVKGFQDAPPPWGEALDKKVSFLADELTPRVDTQGRELTAMAQTLAKAQEADQQNTTRLSERIDTLGTSVVQRVEALDARVTDAEKAADARAKAQVPPDLAAVNKRLDVLGKEMPGRVDDLTQVVSALRGHLQQMGERISLLETIQKQEASDLRERFNALSTALSEITGSRGQ